MTRGVTFWNEETIQLIQKHFVAVSVPTWVCRSDAPEGEFLRQANIHKQWVTSSGYMSCVSASGRMLGKTPSAKVLEEFAKLPESERKPNAVKLSELKPQEQVIPSPPVGGLVLRVHGRFLTQSKEGKLRRAKTTDFPLMLDKPKVQQSWDKFLQPNTEYMWLTSEESKSLVPTNPAEGSKLEVGPHIVERMARFHLTPKRAMTSEGGVVSKRSIKKAAMTLVVTEVMPQFVRLELTGHVHWGTDFDETKATSPNGPLPMGFETSLYGRLVYDRKKGTMTRFDIVAPGHVWGRWGDANGKSMYVERPGRGVFGFAFELATGDSPTDRIPPGGNGKYVLERGYFANTPERKGLQQ